MPPGPAYGIKHSEDPASTSSSRNGELSVWISSYQNHALYLSIYVAVCSFCWKTVTQHHNNGSFVSLCYVGLHYLILALAVLAIHLEVSYIIKRARLPPGDSGLPLLGHLPALIGNAEAFLVQYIPKYGNICTYTALLQPMVFMTMDEDISWIMKQEREGKTKALILPYLRKLLGEEAIMNKSGDAHKRLRKIFEPAFTPLAIRDYALDIDKIAQETLAKWCDSGEWKEPRDWALLAMRIFFVCAFGEADEERMIKLTYLFENWSAGFNTIIPFVFPGTPLHKAHQFRMELGKEMKTMIDEFKAKTPPDSEAAKRSVMGRLCYSVDDEGNAATEEELIDNLRFFLVAGFDTTKATFGAMSKFVTRHPKLEAVLVEEVNSVKEPLDIDQLKNESPILNAFMAESWRLTPPEALHTTCATEDLHYKGYVIQKGTMLSADIQGHAVMNNARYPKASEFHFERWLPKNHPLYDPAFANIEDIDYNVMNNKFRTFNMGPHMCLGGHFAKLEVRIVIARLFQKYKIEIRNERVVMFPAKQILNDFKIIKRER